MKNANTIGITTTTTTTSPNEQIDNAELQNRDNSVSNGVLDDNENDNENKMNDDDDGDDHDDGRENMETASADLNNGSNKNEP